MYNIYIYKVPRINYFYKFDLTNLNDKLIVQTLNRDLFQTPKYPMKSGGSIPCFITNIGVSLSLELGSVSRYC